jgi:hypothetical protein
MARVGTRSIVWMMKRKHRWRHFVAAGALVVGFIATPATAGWYFAIPPTDNIDAPLSSSWSTPASFETEKECEDFQKDWRRLDHGRPLREQAHDEYCGIVENCAVPKTEEKRVEEYILRGIERRDASMCIASDDPRLAK